jgi:signal transduction histidine kinase
VRGQRDPPRRIPLSFPRGSPTFRASHAVPSSQLVLLSTLTPRMANLIRLVGLALITWSVLAARHHPAASGRGLVVAISYLLAAGAWMVWMAWPDRPRGLGWELYVLAAAGGLLTFASPGSAGSAFVFVAVAAGGLRAEVSRAFVLVLLGAAGVALGALLYHGSALGLLAYGLGFSAVLLAASNGRQSLLRADQAELLLAQTQRSHEEQLRVARLEESTRIAREIHDVLAHALAGLAIQLEATSTLLAQGADRDAILARVTRAHELARDGLRETRRAVGALRGDPVLAADEIERLVDEHRTTAEDAAELTMDGDRGRLSGPTGETALRVVQEALTNVRKHAPGAHVAVTVHAGRAAGDGIVVAIEDHARTGPASMPRTGVADTGGGFGIRGMRERAELLGGSLEAGPSDRGWRVELRLPPPAGAPEPEPAAASA